MPDNQNWSTTPSEYECAMDLWPSNLDGLVRNLAPRPYWLGGAAARDDRFWYKQETDRGHQFVLVDPASRTKAPAFDHTKLALGLRTIMEDEVDPEKLPFQRFWYLADDKITFPVGAKKIIASLLDGACLVDQRHDPLALQSPAGDKQLFVQDFNLVLRRQRGPEKALTADGERYNAYGATPDHDRLKIVPTQMGLKLPPIGCFWSPDSRWVLAQKTDERQLESYAFLESVPSGGGPRPIVHNVKVRMTGDSNVAVTKYYLLDTDCVDHVQPVRVPKDWADLEINAHHTGWITWSPDSTHVYVLANNLSFTRVALVRISIASGSAEIVLEERGSTFLDFNTFDYHRPNVAILFERNEAIWYSQSSGWGHLYLIDLATGEIKAPLTEGNWAVCDLLAIDVQAGEVFFTASGREAALSPYARQLYSIPLESTAASGISRLTPEACDHHMPGRPIYLMGHLYGLQDRSPISPSCNYFVDTCSALEGPSKTNVRHRTGAFVMNLETSDVSALAAKGWRAPEPVTVKALWDNEAVHGVLIKPRAFDPNRKYPVVERIYGGPQTIAHPRNFVEAITGTFLYGCYSLAEMGFVVAVIDGPGTPFRSKRFHDAGFGEQDRFGVGHHRAALEALAAHRPWMDTTRVGISGHSWGGYNAVMAMLLHPDFYRVGVSSAGVYDQYASYWDINKKYMGLPDYGSGRAFRETASEIPANLAKSSPSPVAHQLAGRLLLAYGDLDENAPPSSILRFAKSLIMAEKSFDLLALPGRAHGLFSEPYFHKRLIDYFIQHLQGREPVLHLRLGVTPGPRMLV